MNQNRYKYPRTFHLPYSETITNNDKVMSEKELKQNFNNKWVVVTEKLDGENTTLYNDYFHARSLSKPNHPSQDWLKNFHSQFSYKIPDGWRICGENMYAKHTIEYNDLESYFYVFSIWNENNVCLDWRTTFKICSDLRLTLAPIFFIGNFNSFDKLREHYSKVEKGVEGFVIRNANKFHYKDFNKNVVKFVSKKFQINGEHWKHKELVKNGFRNDK